jgi:hypothetical protein
MIEYEREIIGSDGKEFWNEMNAGKEEAYGIFFLFYNILQEVKEIEKKKSILETAVSPS